SATRKRENPPIPRDPDHYHDVLNFGRIDWRRIVVATQDGLYYPSVGRASRRSRAAAKPTSKANFKATDFPGRRAAIGAAHLRGLIRRAPSFLLAGKDFLLTVDDRAIGLERFRISNILFSRWKKRFGIRINVRSVLDSRVIDRVVGVTDVRHWLWFGESKYRRFVSDADFNRTASAFTAFAGSRRDDLSRSNSTEAEEQHGKDHHVH